MLSSLKPLGTNEKIILDNSIHNHLLKNEPGAEKIWNVLLHLTPRVGGGNLILTSLAALETIGFNLKEFKSDYSFSKYDKDVLRSFYDKPGAFIEDGREVFGRVYKYYRDAVEIVVNSEDKEMLQRCFLKQKEHIVGVESKTWYEEAIGDHFVEEALSKIVSHIALDRVMDSHLVGKEKISLDLMILTSKYRPKSPFKNLGTYCLMQNFFKNRLHIQKPNKKELPTYLHALLQKARLKSRKDYMDSESITYLIEGYDESPVIYLTLEPRVDIECRINVAMNGSLFLKEEARIDIPQRYGRVLFFDRNMNFSELNEFHAYLGIEECIRMSSCFS